MGTRAAVVPTARTKKPDGQPPLPGAEQQVGHHEGEQQAVQQSVADAVPRPVAEDRRERELGIRVSQWEIEVRQAGHGGVVACVRDRTQVVETGVVVRHGAEGRGRKVDGGHEQAGDEEPSTAVAGVSASDRLGAGPGGSRTAPGRGRRPMTIVAAAPLLSGRTRLMPRMVMARTSSPHQSDARSVRAESVPRSAPGPPGARQSRARPRTRASERDQARAERQFDGHRSWVRPASSGSTRWCGPGRPSAGSWAPSRESPSRE